MRQISETSEGQRQDVRAREGIDPATPSDGARFLHQIDESLGMGAGAAASWSGEVLPKRKSAKSSETVSEEERLQLWRASQVPMPSLGESGTASVQTEAPQRLKKFFKGLIAPANHH